MKYKVGDKTFFGEIVSFDKEGRKNYTVENEEGYTRFFDESEIDAIIIKPKRNIDKIAELWSDGKREDAKELYDHIQFIEGSYSGTMINGLLAPYSEPSRYPKLTPDELKAVKWLIDGGYESLKVDGSGTYAAYGDLSELRYVSLKINPITRGMNNAKWITESPINLRELLAAQEEL